MSAAQNLERVRSWQAAMSTSREAALAAVSTHWDADADYCPVRKFPETRPRHGREKVSEFITEFLDAYSLSKFVVRELVAVDENRVLVCMSMQTEGRASGISLEGDLYQSVWLRDARFIRVEDHLTLKGALEALGLEGETLEGAGLRG